MTTFGPTSHDGATTMQVPDNWKGCTSVTCPSGGSVEKISVYWRHVDGNCVAKGVIYNYVGNLLATSFEVAEPASDQWVDFTFSTAVTVSALPYYIGVIVGGTTFTSYKAVGTYTTYGNADTYSDGPTAAFGSMTELGLPLPAYATFSNQGTGAVSVGVQLGGSGYLGAVGSGALQIGAVALGGTGHMDCVGSGALTIASPTLSGGMWMDSAHLRHIVGRANIYGVKGKAQVWGLRGKAEL